MLRGLRGHYLVVAFAKGGGHYLVVVAFCKRWDLLAAALLLKPSPCQMQIKVALPGNRSQYETLTELPCIKLKLVQARLWYAGKIASYSVNALRGVWLWFVADPR